MTKQNTPWSWRGNILVLRLHLQPGAKATELVGLHDGRLKIRLRAAPVDGKANKALCTFMSELFKVPKSSVSIKSGNSGRKKTLLIDNPQFLPAEFLALQ